MPQTGRPEHAPPWNASGGVLGVELDEAQYRLIRDLGTEVAAHLPLDLLVCRGMWLRAVRMYQAETRLPVRHVTGLPPDARLRAALRIRDHFMMLAAEQLGIPSDSHALQKCAAAAEAMYRAKYHQR